MNWNPRSRRPAPAAQLPYRPDATDFTDIPLQQPPGIGGLVHVCPKCRGHGRWNLRLDAYGPGKHFQCGCGQCNGWGFVGESDWRCVHDYRELTPAECGTRGIPHYGMCWHVLECVTCGRCLSYDSGD
ncbi:MAG: hypothetical protein L0Z62_29705 [Gemmataceae bacterium]|nr:hypothetical protein [Gemmataceae bacterium]